MKTELEEGKVYKFVLGRRMGAMLEGTWYEGQVMDDQRVVVTDKGSRYSSDKVGKVCRLTDLTGYQSITPLEPSVTTDDAERALSDAFRPEPPRGNLKWAAVDLDGTLAEGVWTPDNPTSEIGPLRPEAKRKVDALVAAGYKIVIHTSRSWTDFENIEKWCAHNGIPIRGIVPGKLLAAVYIDDRALNDSESSWLPEVAKDLHAQGEVTSKARLENSEQEARTQDLLHAWDTYADTPSLVGGVDGIMRAVQNFVRAERGR